MNVKEILNQAKLLKNQKKLEQAIDLYQQAYAIFEEAENWPKAIDCLYHIIHTKVLQLQLKGIKTPNWEGYFKERLEFAQTKLDPNDSLIIALRLKDTQYLFYDKQYEKAIKKANQILQESSSANKPNVDGVIYVYVFIAKCYKYARDREEHLAYMQEVLRIFEQDKKLYQKGIFEICVMLGSFYYYIDLSESLRYLNRALDLSQTIDDLNDADLRSLYNSLGIAYYEQHDVEKAIQYFQKVAHISLSKEINTIQLPFTYMNIGNCYNKKNELEQSEFYFEKALEQGIKIHGAKGANVGVINTNYSIMLMHKGDLDKALECLHTAASIFENITHDEQNWKDKINEGLSQCYLKRADYEKSIFYAHKVIQGKVFQSKKYIAWNVEQLFMIGRCYKGKKAFIKASHYLQEALQLACKDFEETNHYINPTLNSIQLKGPIIKVLEEKGRGFLGEFQKTNNWMYGCAGLFSYQLATQLQNQLYQQYDSESSKISLHSILDTLHYRLIEAFLFVINKMETNEEAYIKAIPTLIELNARYHPPHTFPYIKNLKECKEKLFFYGEQFKGKVLLDKLKTNQAIFKAQLPAHLIQQEANLKQELIALEKKVSQAKLALSKADGQAIKQLFQELAFLQTQHLDIQETYQATITEIETISPHCFSVNEQEEIVRLETLQQVLTPQQLVLSYVVVIDEIVIYCVGRELYQVISIDKPKDFDQLVKRFLKAINQLRYQRYVHLASQFYQLLIEPALHISQTDKVDELIIIPHNSLTYIPFESLLTFEPNDKEINYSNLPYLINAFKISYHYSASLFYHQVQSQNTKQKQEDSFVGFAPVYQQKTPLQAKANKEFVVPQELENISAHSRSIRIGDQNYAALVHSEEEVNEVQKIFEQQEKHSESFLHELATVEQFKKVVKGKKYIHVAAHGFETKTESGLTGIIFSPDSKEDIQQEDAVLYLPDMYGLQLDADLVVLSSCKSGIGRLQGGEGMMAMNRGFLAAGAQNVVYTLFKIYDQASSEFVKYFFEQIVVHQKNYKEALQASKQYMIQKEGFTPKHWAGFVLIGQ